LLRNRNFQALWIGRFVASLGKETAEIAYPLLTLAITGSATYAGIIGAIQVVTASLCAVPGGILGDRFNRKRMLIVCDLIRLVLLTAFGTLILTVGVTVPVVLAVAMCSAACLGLSNPVALALIKQLVPLEQVSSAAAQNQIRFFSSTVIGPPIGGALFAVGRAFPFLAEAVSYGISSAVTLLIRQPKRSRPPDSARPRSWRGASAGFRFMARHPILRPMMMWITGFNMAFTHTGAFLALIAVADSRGASSSEIGLVISLAGFSGLLGAFVSGVVVNRIRPSFIFLTAAWFAPVGAIVLAFMPGTVGLGIMLGAVFALVPSVNALVFGYLGVAVPDELQGRVMGAVAFLSLIAQPIGIFGVGIIFDTFGPKWVFLAMAAAAGLAALPTLTRHIRRLPPPAEVAVE
jgi:predicted MFS family arabinose efflux permease